MEILVADNEEMQRFEARVGDDLAGFAEYRPREGVLAFTHTEIDPAYRGKGIGGVLIGAALDKVHSDGGRVSPLCSYVADFVSKRPEYAGLVAYGRSDAGGA